MNTFDERFLMVPIVEAGKVISVLQVPRHGNKVYFYYTDSENNLAFFQGLVFSKHRKALPAELPSETGKTICNTEWISVWMPNDESNPDPESGSGHWETSSVIVCTQVVDDCLGIVLPNGQCDISGGGDGGGYEYPAGGENPETPQQTPCETTEPFIANANNFIHDSEVKTKMDDILKGKTQAPNEWGIAVGETSAGYNVTAPKEGSNTEGTIPSSQIAGTYVGDGHSHAGGFGDPSGGDFYGMLTTMLTNTGLKYRFVYGDYFGSPEVYVLVVNDRDLAITFLANYPKNENYDETSHSFLRESIVGEAYYTASELFSKGTYLDSSGETYNNGAISMAYILDKYNTGMNIAKVDANGNLKKVNASIEKIEVPGSGGVEKTGVKISKCP